MNRYRDCPKCNSIKPMPDGKRTTLADIVIGVFVLAAVVYLVTRMPDGLEPLESRAGSYENSLKIAGVVR